MITNIEKYAMENHVPIMQKDGIEYLCNFILENRIKNILEIGTAIGYSAMLLLLRGMKKDTIWLVKIF